MFTIRFVHTTRMFRYRTAVLSLISLLLIATISHAADLRTSLKPGKADLKSAGALAFGPDGVLFVGDSVGGAIFAIDTGDATQAGAAPVNVKGIVEKIAAVLGVAQNQILINDVATNPASHNVYFSASRGRGSSAIPVIVRVDSTGKIEPLSLDNVRHSKSMLENLGARRGSAITDLAFADDQVYVAGLSNEEFSSNLRVIPFPFGETSNSGASIEIWHTSHGQFETNAPIETFVPYKVNQQANILAAYTCTPLVRLPVASLKPGARVTGSTLAELGSGNRPIDMIAYTKDGGNFILLANSSRGVMKLPVDNLDSYVPITSSGDIAGVLFETIPYLRGVTQLDKFDDDRAVILWRRGGASLELTTIALP